MEEKICVFTYGTLMRGRRNHQLIEGGEFLGEYTLNDYVLYELGSYPGIIPGKGGIVKGECYSISPRQLALLDQLEEEGSLYRRSTETVYNSSHSIKAAVYIYLLSVEGKTRVSPENQPWSPNAAKTTWDSAQYLKFRGERTQPAIDLLNRLSYESPRRIVDIGCGPGNSTQVLQRRYSHSDIWGVDSSEAMINAARKDYPDMEFLLCDIQKDLSLLGKNYDIVFSNACLQWVPEHHNLLPRLFALLHPEGELAVQVPLNQDAPMHVILRELSTSPPWWDLLGSPRVFHTLIPQEYWDILTEQSTGFNMWETTYFHRMESHQAIVQWAKGTGMRPYLEALPIGEQPRFISEFLREIEKAYTPQRGGEILFPFKRLFFTAIK